MDKKELHVFHWNLQHSQGCQQRGDTGDYAAFQWKHRRQAALALLRKQTCTADVVTLTEIRRYNCDDIRAVLMETMDNPYVWASPYGGRKGPSGEDDDRDLLVVAIRCHATAPAQVETGTEHALAVLVPDLKGRATLVVAMHFPIREEHRLDVAQCIGAKLQTAAYHADSVVIAGDMNAFPDAGGHLQMHTMMAPLRVLDATQFLKRNSDGRRAHSTFRPYPYDSVPALDDPDKLDYVLSHGLVPTEAVVIDDQPVCCAPDYGPSDHMPVLVTFDVPPK